VRDELGENGGLVPGTGTDLEDSVAGFGSSRSVIRATMNGCEIVWPSPMGSARFS
jgi:hypothetical protein